jgi:hypothetical protein
MKRRMTLSIALVVCLTILSLMIPVSMTKAQNQIRFVADTGVVTLGPNQVLRITVNAGSGDDAVTIRFRQITYQPVAMQQGITSLAVASQTTTAPLMLAAGEAASLELVATTYGRGVILSNSRNVRATLQIINTSTGETTSHIIMANTEGDFH